MSRKENIVFAILIVTDYSFTGMVYSKHQELESFGYTVAIFVDSDFDFSRLHRC